MNIWSKQYGAKLAHHDVDNGPQAGQGRPDGGAHETGLRNRGVADSFGPELLDQPLRDAERPTHCAFQGSSEAGPTGNVLTQDDHAGVPAHGFGEPFVDSLDI